MAKRVALITPPLDASGGIGRLMSYVLANVSGDDVAVRLLDPRGHSRRPILSIFPLMRAWAAFVALALTRRVDLAHINVSSHGSSIRKSIMSWTSRLLGVPVVLHLHASEYQRFFAGLPRPAKALLRRTFASADTVIVLGEHYREYVCRELEVPAGNVTVLLNGSPGPTAAPVIEPRADGPLRIVFLGRLGSRKGVGDALVALADPRLRSEQWHASFAGDGEVQRYRAQAQDLGIGDRVSFCGWVDTEQTSRLLGESHLLLLPSHAEGLPMSVIEAFAHGVPVLSTPVGSIPDIVQDEANGLLVAPGHTDALTQAMLRLLHDEPLRLRLARNARHTWEQQLSIASYTRELLSCWEEVLDVPQGRLAHA
jgi:glycosyltransferase involved in cell wall biosynthesis